MIKNIIFDIGRVLLQFEPLEYLNKKYKDENLSNTLYNCIFASKEWIELDRGSITNEEAIKVFCSRNNNHTKYIMDIMNDWTNILRPIETSVDILKNLKLSGYNIFLLSNFHDKAFKIIDDNYDFFKLADGKVISSRVNLLKPDKEIYEYLLSSYALKPEESLFIDDTLVNIAAAKSLGMNVIHFNNPDQLGSELKNLGLL